MEMTVGGADLKTMYLNNEKIAENFKYTRQF